MVTDIMWL